MKGFRSSIAVIMVVSCLSFDDAISSERKYLPLSMHGMEYSSACSNPEMQELKKELVGNIDNYRQAAELVETILCAPQDPATFAYLRKSLSKQILSRLYGTGDRPEVVVSTFDTDTIKDMLASGKA